MRPRVEDNTGNTTAKRPKLSIKEYWAQKVSVEQTRLDMEAHSCKCGCCKNVLVDYDVVSCRLSNARKSAVERTDFIKSCVSLARRVDSKGNDFFTFISHGGREICRGAWLVEQGFSAASLSRICLFLI